MESRLHQHTVVACPLAQAGRRISEFFGARVSTEDKKSRLSLSIDARIPGLSAPVHLQRSVVVTFEAPAHEGEITPQYKVAWAPADPGPFPLFIGALRVEATDDYESFLLVLEGTYEPPLGALGAAFDSLIGSRIAGVCARNLLARIAEEIETKFLADEAKKAEARHAAATTKQ